MTERDQHPKTNKENETPAPNFFFVGKDDVAVCVMLAMDMTKTGKGDFVVKQPKDADIDPTTGYLYEGENEGKVRLLREGQDDYRAYDFALGEVLDVKRGFQSWAGEEDADFFTTWAVADEIQKQVDYFKYDIGKYKDFLTPEKSTSK